MIDNEFTLVSNEFNLISDNQYVVVINSKRKWHLSGAMACAFISGIRAVGYAFIDVFNHDGTVCGTDEVTRI